MKRLGVFFALVATMSVVTVLTIAPAAPAAAPKATISNTINAATPGGGTLTGTLSNLRFVNRNGNLDLTGNLTATLRNAAGTVIGSVTNLPIDLPLIGSQPAPSCRILDLTLGPLHLDLLGLIIDLNQVHLTITAQPGPGNLLGNLLCGVAHLLDSNANVNTLARLLNRLLGL